MNSIIQGMSCAIATQDEFKIAFELRVRCSRLIFHCQKKF